MALPGYVNIKYTVPYSVERVARLLEVLDQALQANWSRYKDQWSHPRPEYGISREAWLEAAHPENLSKLSDLTHNEQHESYQYTKPVSGNHNFTFCPTSPCPMGVRLIREDGLLAVTLEVSKWICWEFEGAVMLSQMEWELRQNPDRDDDDEWLDMYHDLKMKDKRLWPINKACLDHIVERLTALYPVKSLEISEEFLEEDA